MRSIKSSIITAAVLVLIPLASFAAELEFIVLRLEDKYNNISTITAEFTQETVSKAFGTRHVSTGTVYLKKPGKMRWMFFSPTRDELVSNGAKVWFYQQDLSQVVEESVGPSGNIATNFLSGVVNLRRHFLLKLTSETESSYVIELTPTVPQTAARKISLEIDRFDMSVQRTVVEDLFGNITTVTFSNVFPNAAISDSFFEFKVPPGVRVLKR